MCDKYNSLSNISEYHGIKIIWDRDHDTRVLCWIDSLNRNTQKKISEVGESKGSLKVVLFNPYTEEEFLRECAPDGGIGIGHRELNGEYCCLCCDWWNIWEVTTIDTLYKEYINSHEWKTLSKEFKKNNNGFCSLCNVWVGYENLETHHIKYPKDFKNDNSKNWIAICKICHGKLHGVNP